jgi:hypothetical protein
MQHPNWNAFAIGSESAAYGALHEFHRQRQAYFVQDVKMSSIPYQWLAFQATYPNILNDVPTPGRCIKWEELETTIVPPVFGNSQPRDLLWALRPRFNPADPAQGSTEDMTAPANVAETIPETVLVPWSGVLCSHRGLGWIFLLLATIWVFATGIYFDLLSKEYWAALAIVLSMTLFYHTALFLLLRIADYFELHPDTFLSRNLPEVAFVGRRRHADNAEGPYFSASGRWRHGRRNRLARPLLLLTIGLILLSLSLTSSSPFMGALALLFIVPVCNTALLQTSILNFVPLPPLVEYPQPNPMPFSHMMQTLWILQILTGIGAAFILSEIDSSPSATGVFLVMLGVGLTIATLLPRICSEQFYAPRPRAMDQSRSFWIGLVVSLYCLWFFFFFSNGEALSALIIGPILSLHCWLSALSPQPGAVDPGVQQVDEDGIEGGAEHNVEHDVQGGIDNNAHPDVDVDIELPAEPGAGNMVEDDIELARVASVPR